jgi:hypothetical protein
MQVSLQEVVVSPIGAAPRLLSYRGKPLDAQMADLDLGAGYAAAVTVLSSDRVRVRIMSGATLLGDYGSPPVNLRPPVR